MKYFIIPFGCATNKSDAERIAAILNDAGFIPAKTEQEADILGIVACSIRQSAIDRVIGRANIWNKWKAEKNLITFLSGCVLPEDAKKFNVSFDYVLKLTEVVHLPEMIKQLKISMVGDFWDVRPQRESSFKALVSIQNGCNNYCTYCAVPYTRGREVSRSAESILEEIDELIAKKYKQITILGQNVNSYGLDKPDSEISFAELLQEIGIRADRAMHEIYIYYTSPHPRDMNKEVYETQAKFRSLAPYLNLPLQSGNNEILKKMNRGYSVEEYMKKLELARKMIPELTVSTDIIVGFCGETEEQFQDTLSAMKQGNFDMAFIAKYSPRPHAVAGKHFNDDVSHYEKKQRDERVTEVLRQTALEHNKKIVGKTIRVLAESKSRKPGLLLGRSAGLKSVEFSGAPGIIGRYFDVNIKDCDAWRLYGEISN